MPDKAKDIDHWVNELLSEVPLLLNKIRLNTSLDTEAKAVEGLNETLRFLHLCSVADSSLTPSEVVDMIWHELILFTRTYYLFCNSKFGEFVHHQPSNDHTNVINQYKKTLTLYKLHFGTPNNHYWPIPEKEMAKCGPCEA
jgi:hypothetical protein